MSVQEVIKGKRRYFAQTIVVVLTVGVLVLSALAATAAAQAQSLADTIDPTAQNEEVPDEVSEPAASAAPAVHPLAGVDMSNVVCSAPRIATQSASGDDFHPLSGADMTKVTCSAPRFGVQLEAGRATRVFRPLEGLELGDIVCSAPNTGSATSGDGFHPLAAADMSELRCSAQQVGE